MSRAAIIHKHHIIPRHIGGHNSPTKEVSIAEHAEEHRQLWIKDGREYDRIAWLALSGQIGKEEIILRVLQSPERRRKISESRRGMKFSHNHRQNLSLSHKGQTAWNKGLTKKDPRVAQYTSSLIGRKLSEEHKINIGKAMKGKPWSQKRIDAQTRRYDNFKSR